jgi:hypothetical protein
LLAFVADKTSTPGANRSTSDPKLENEGYASSMSLAPTINASATRCGEKKAALAPSFPAAIA